VEAPAKSERKRKRIEASNGRLVAPMKTGVPHGLPPPLRVEIAVFEADSVRPIAHPVHQGERRDVETSAGDMVFDHDDVGHTGALGKQPDRVGRMMENVNEEHASGLPIHQGKLSAIEQFDRDPGLGPSEYVESPRFDVRSQPGDGQCERPVPAADVGEKAGRQKRGESFREHTEASGKYESPVKPANRPDKTGIRRCHRPAIIAGVRRVA
jgi:hypothetical protein